MKPLDNPVDRRKFLRSTVLLSAGITSLGVLPTDVGAEPLKDEPMNVIGPREGYAPQVGTLVSMMTWMRDVILSPVKGLSVEQLDYIHDDNANSIGSMLFHLAATERFYYLHTIEGKKWGEWDAKDKERFDVAMNLGDEGRKSIKGNNLAFYTDILKEVRDNSLTAFKKRDDKWLLTVDKDWYWGPTNNYCKWFHVVEHESNHNGQIKWIKGRLPGGKNGE